MIEITGFEQEYHFKGIHLYQMDCMELITRLPDKYFDLAIVDPPYGIGRADNVLTIGKNTSSKNSFIRRSDYKNKKWDNKPPNKNYFEDLIRISKNQIIFGANHFIENIPHANSSCWIIWDKVDALPTYASGEMAWTSFDSPMKIVPLRHSGFKRGVNIGKESKIIYNVPFSGAMDIHPTQKPVQLYKWLLKNYAKPEFKIFDSHLGSGSSAIAAYDFGCDFTGCEIDKEYYDAAVKRFEIHKAQIKLF